MTCKIKDCETPFSDINYYGIGNNIMICNQCKNMLLLRITTMFLLMITLFFYPQTFLLECQICIILNLSMFGEILLYIFLYFVQ